jgi:hypothetical protein
MTTNLRIDSTTSHRSIRVFLSAPILALPIVSFVGLIAAPVASAGTTILSGDSNLGNGIDGSGGTPITPGNSRWFNNILGAGTSVKIQIEATAATESAAAINNYYNSLPGVTSSFFSGTIAPAELAGVNLFISMLPNNDYTAGEISALSGFLNGGGTLLLCGDASQNFSASNGRLNAALAALGSSMRLGTASLDPGINTTTNIVADPLNAGVSSFTYAFTDDIVGGGHPLLRTVNGSGALPFVAMQDPSTLLGDYNHNGVVDAPDYVVWRKGLGTIYTQTDYDVWRAHFGQTAGSGAGGITNAAVPEPATLLMMLTGILTLVARHHTFVL